MTKHLPFVDVGDTHGSEIDPALEKLFFEWLSDFKPKLRIHGGDYLNLAALRRGATPDERREAIAPDIQAGKDFVRRLFDGGQENYLTRGNHDERVYNVAREAQEAQLREHAEATCRDLDNHLRKLRVKQLKYDARLGVLDVHGLRVIHGYAAGIGAARKFGQIYGPCSFHHTHSMEVCPVEKWPETAVAYGSGCLCKIDQGYNSTQTNKLRHENGWLYGYTDGNRVTYFQARYQDGKIIVADGIKVYCS